MWWSLSQSKNLTSEVRHFCLVLEVSNIYSFVPGPRDSQVLAQKSQETGLPGSAEDDKKNFYEMILLQNKGLPSREAALPQLFPRAVGGRHSSPSHPLWLSCPNKEREGKLRNSHTGDNLETLRFHHQKRGHSPSPTFNQHTCRAPV